MKLIKPELLAPAGNYEKAMIAFHYGADAVYVGGTVFGLRKYADNLSLHELNNLITYANQHQKQVYVVLNAFAHNSDIEPIISYLKELEALKPHALIVSDSGVMTLVRKYTSLAIHVSTQASVTNSLACQYYKDLGAKRIILAREVTIRDCCEIKKSCDIELEIFVHGAMCASYSGKCVISNYSAGRDSNRGGCVQSCRHKYHLIDPQSGENQGSAHIMNAKDLMGIKTLPEIIKAGIESVKIEGRMKSNLYVANAVAMYRQAIDACYNQLIQNLPIKETFFDSFIDQLSAVSNRSFSLGGLENRPHSESINTHFSHYQKEVHYLGLVHDSDKQGQWVCSLKADFTKSDTLLIATPQHPFEEISPTGVFDLQDNPIEKGKPNSMIKLKVDKPMKPLSLLIKAVSS